MKTTPRALMLLAVWIAVLVGLSIVVQRELVVGTDLRLFLPEPKTPQEKLLLNELGEGPGSRLLVIALSNASEERLAETSTKLVGALNERAEFKLVANGATSLDSVPDALWPYRFILTDAFDKKPINEAYLRDELVARERDLSSPAASLLETILPRDPTLEILNLMQRWQPSQQPERRYDVWFDRRGERALLLVETVAPAFDPDRQSDAIRSIRAAFDRTKSEPGMQMVVSGVGAFSMLMKNRTQGEAQTLGMFATVGMIALVLFAYRRVGAAVLGALPLASAAIGGLLATASCFDAIHGITLAFGFTLIGVAQDYPLHLLSHQHADSPPLDVARKLWPPLSTGVASTCIAYLTFLFSGVAGLAQLAVFTIAGLAAAGLTTRFLLPRLIDRTDRDFADSKTISHLNARLESFSRRSEFLIVAVIASAVALTVPSQPFWENDLSTLTPVPPELLREDQALRDELGTADVRYMLVLSARDDAEASLKLEALNDGLNELVARGAIRGFDHIANYVPSAPTQLGRRQRLPDRDAVKAELGQALRGLSFREDAFEPFLADLAQAKQLPVLTAQALQGSPLAARTEMLLAKSAAGTSAFITLSGVADPRLLEEFAAGRGIVFLDLKTASEGLVARQRTWILGSLAVAAVLLIVVIGFALRDAKRVLKVVAPMALTTLFVVAILHAAGVSLSLFHLISLVLCAGLGLDYALFFEQATHDPREQRRTLHAVLTCSASTLMVFALLMLSSVPVLKAIGATVTLGVIGNFFLALLLTRASKPSILSERHA